MGSEVGDPATSLTVFAAMGVPFTGASRSVTTASSPEISHLRKFGWGRFSVVSGQESKTPVQWTRADMFVGLRP